VAAADAGGADPRPVFADYRKAFGDLAAIMHRNEAVRATAKERGAKAVAGMTAMVARVLDTADGTASATRSWMWIAAAAGVAPAVGAALLTSRAISRPILALIGPGGRLVAGLTA